MNNFPSIRWARNKSLAPVLSSFMSENMDPDYISHGELQTGRAISLDKWDTDLQDILQKEITSCLTSSGFPDGNTRIAYAAIGETTVAVMIIGLNLNEGTKYAVLEDLVVHKEYRRKGIGKMMMAWLEEQMEKEGISRIFLESGNRNNDAHLFFEDMGFQKCSIVMFKDI